MKLIEIYTHPLQGRAYLYHTGEYQYQLSSLDKKVFVEFYDVPLEDVREAVLQKGFGWVAFAEFIPAN